MKEEKRGPGRPKVENGKRYNIVVNPDELKQIKQLLKEIRSNGKTN